jgi:ribonuclease HI
MKQLCLFDDATQQHTVTWQLFIDGASRNNPGPSGAGIVIYKNDEPFAQEGFFLGIRTNNQAEYLALLIGIYKVRMHMHANDGLTIVSDSELLVRQLNGRYKITNPELKKLFHLAQHLLTGLTCSIKHVLRAANKQADLMANAGVDSRHPVPPEFKILLEEHGIKWSH